MMFWFDFYLQRLLLEIQGGLGIAFTPVLIDCCAPGVVSPWKLFYLCPVGLVAPSGETKKHKNNRKLKKQIDRKNEKKSFPSKFYHILGTSDRFIKRSRMSEI